MKTCNKFKMRLLRGYVIMKKNLLEWSILAVLFIIFSIGLYRVVMWGQYMISYAYHAYILDDMYDSYNDWQNLNDELCFYENGQHSYIRNKKTGKKVLRNISWVAGIYSEDSLLCFAKDGYRGFLNRHTGKVMIPADRYRKAWLFSEGLAAVMEEDSTLKFIDTSGKEMIDVKSKYTSKGGEHDFIFKNGYCAMIGPGNVWGVIDHAGNWAVVPQYDGITYADNGFWTVEKNGRKGMLNGKMQLVAAPIYKDISIGTDGIDVLKEDYTRQLLSFDGNLINGFTYIGVDDLSYKTGCVDEDEGEYEWELSPYKAYYTTSYWDDTVKVGLLSPDGIPVTPPIYSKIIAVNANCFRGFYNEPSGDEGVSVLFNSKGHVIDPGR